MAARSDTRERLIEAALALLHEGGEAAVTTTAVTRAAGVVQSAFYKHFANVGECLGVAAGRITEEIRRAVAQSRQRMYDEGPGAGEDLERFYRGVFALMASQRAIVQLFLRHRCDPLALAGVPFRAGRGLCDDLAEQLRGQMAKHSLIAPPGWVEATAELLTAAGFAAIEALLAGRGPSEEESARLLAAFSTAACLGVVQAMATAS